MADWRPLRSPRQSTRQAPKWLRVKSAPERKRFAPFEFRHSGKPKAADGNAHRVRPTSVKDLEIMP